MTLEISALTLKTAAINVGKFMIRRPFSILALVLFTLWLSSCSVLPTADIEEYVTTAAVEVARQAILESGLGDGAADQVEQLIEAIDELHDAIHNLQNALS